jgi:hypothetical protein
MTNKAEGEGKTCAAKSTELKKQEAGRMGVRVQIRV